MNCGTTMRQSKLQRVVLDLGHECKIPKIYVDLGNEKRGLIQLFELNSIRKRKRSTSRNDEHDFENEQN